MLPAVDAPKTVETGFYSIAMPWTNPNGVWKQETIGMQYVKDKFTN